MLESKVMQEIKPDMPPFVYIIVTLAALPFFVKDYIKSHYDSRARSLRAFARELREKYPRWY